MTDHWQGPIRRAGEQDGAAYCPYCLVAESTDADPLTDFGNTPIAAARADQDTDTLAEVLHPYGWICDRHDTLCLRDPYMFDDPSESLVMVTFQGNTGDSITALVPDDDLADAADTTDDRADAGDTTDDPPWIDDYDHVVRLTTNNAPRSCHDCGDAAAYYLTAPATFVCAECDP